VNSKEMTSEIVSLNKIFEKKNEQGENPNWEIFV
jgi:hypothetical protein